MVFVWCDGALARRSERITPLLRELHWLRVPEWVTFRLCVLAYRCLRGTAPRMYTLLRACTGHLMSTFVVVCALLTQPCWWYRPPDVQHSVTVPSQWLRHMRVTACRCLSGMRRRWRRSVASWRVYLLLFRSLFDNDYAIVIVLHSRLLSARDYWLSAILSFVFAFLFNFVRCPCNVFVTW